jgi:hypothetical protein
MPRKLALILAALVVAGLGSCGEAQSSQSCEAL